MFCLGEAKCSDLDVESYSSCRHIAECCKNFAEFQQRFPARPYWEDASEENKSNAENTQKGLGLFKRRKKVSWLGLLAMLLYVGSLGFYLWVRITKTLDLGPYL